MITSVGCGVGAAVLWGLTTLFLSSAAQGATPRTFGFWLLFTQALILLVPGIVAAATSSWSLVAGLMVLLAALAQALAMLTYQRALRDEQVAVIAPLVALEGVFAAMLAIATGEPLSPVLAAGLILVVPGGLLVGMPSHVRWMSPGSRYAILTAALFGSTLWLIAESTLDPLVTLLLFNGMAAVLVLALPREGAESWAVTLAGRELGALLAAGGLSLGGLGLFMVGARSGSVAVTAILGAQFSVIAVIGGYLRFGNRLEARQLLGVALLTVGASVVAGGAA